MSRKCLLIFVFIAFFTGNVDAGSIDKVKMYRVKTEFLEMKTAASRGMPVVNVIENDQTFSLIKKRTNWIKIKSSFGDVGWIREKDFYDAIGEKEYREKKDYLSSKWELGISGGMFGREKSYALSSGYYFIPNILISVEATQTSGSYSSSILGVGNIAFNTYRYSYLSPYVNFGSGILINTPRQTLVNAHENRQAVYYYGAGFSVNPYKNMSIRLSIRDVYLLDKKENYYNWHIGVFGAFF